MKATLLPSLPRTCSTPSTSLPKNHRGVHRQAARALAGRRQRRRQDGAPLAHDLLVEHGVERRQRRRLGVALQRPPRLHQLGGGVAHVDRRRVGRAEDVEQVAQDALEELALLERGRDRLHEGVEGAQLAIGLLQLGQPVRHARLARHRGVERVDDGRGRLDADLGVHLAEAAAAGVDRAGALGDLGLELEEERAEAHHVVGRQLLALDLDVVDEGAVGAVEVVDDVAARLGRDLGVLPGDARVVEDDVVVRATPDQAGRVEREAVPREIALEGDEPSQRVSPSASPAHRRAKGAGRASGRAAGGGRSPWAAR